MKKTVEKKGITKRSKRKVIKNMKKQGKTSTLAKKKMRLVCRPSSLMDINEHLLDIVCLSNRSEMQSYINMAGFGFLLQINHRDPSPIDVKEVFTFLKGQQRFFVPKDYFRQLYNLNFGTEEMDPKGTFNDFSTRTRFKSEIEQFGIEVSKDYRVKIEHVKAVLMGNMEIYNYDWVKLYIFYAIGVFIGTTGFRY